MVDKQSCYDVVVVGSGVAGLSLVIGISEDYPDATILVVSKSGVTSSNTAYAQGGIAVVHDRLKMAFDSLESHKMDTMIAGAKVGDSLVVDKVVRRGSYLLSKLEDWGVLFDKTEAEGYDVSMEGGHSYRRIFHRRDSTGLEIQTKLYTYASKLPKITFLDYKMVTELVISESRCVGLVLFDPVMSDFCRISSKFVVLATGGVGQVYQRTTNATVATGDGLVLAMKSGCELEGMHLMQFHPTALYDERSNESEKPPAVFLISEALRGERAILRNFHGEAFMRKYHDRAELAPRDEVARAILSEMQRTNAPCVYLDISELDFEYFKRKFPGIHQKCLEVKLNLPKDWIPVVPAAHYLCGGIRVDEDAQTNINGLFAVGECASTGLHGANRLASNSLLEALAFADFAKLKIMEEIRVTTLHRQTASNLQESFKTPTLGDLKVASKLLKELKDVCQRDLGVIKSNQSIRNAQGALEDIRDQFERFQLDTKAHQKVFELSGLITVAQAIQSSCEAQTQNIGVYYNTDLVKKT